MAEASVVYRAIADFTTLRKEVRALKRDLRELKAEEAAFNSAQAGNIDQSPVFKRTARAAKQSGAAYSSHTKIVRQNTAATEANERSVRQHALAAASQIKQIERARTTIVRQSRDVQRATQAEIVHTGTVSKSVEVYRSAEKGLSQLEGGYVKLIEVRRVAEDGARSLARTEQKASSDIVRATQDVVRAKSRLPSVSRAGGLPSLPRPGSGSGGGGGSSNNRPIPDPDPGGRAAKSVDNVLNKITGLGRGIFKLIAIVLLIGSALGPAIAALGALGSAALAVVGALGQTVGALLTLPAAGAVAALSITTLIVALKGITKVFQAYSQQQKTAGADAAASAKAQKMAARQVADAVRALARARTDAARAAKDAAQQVADSERSLAKAQKNVMRAQLDLNKARKEALRDLQDLRQEVARGGLDEESAVAALAKAQQEYNNVEADANSTAADRLDALARLHNAEQDLADVRSKRARDAQDLAEAEKKGVEGSDKVTSAKDNQADAEENLADAQRALKRAQEDQARGAVDAAQRIADAQRNLADAQDAVKDAQKKSSAGADAFNSELKKLSPSAQKFVLGLIAMKDQFTAIKKSVQEAFFGPLVGQLGNIRGALKPIRENLTLVAGALGDVAAMFIEWLTSPEMRPFFKYLSEETAKIIRILGPALIDLFTAFTNIIEAGLPFIEKFATAIAGMAKSFKNWSEDGKGLNDTIQTGVDRLQQFWDIISNLGGAFINLMQAADPFIDWIMNGLVTGTQNFEDFTEAQKMEGSPFKTYLENIKPLLKEVGGLAKDFIGYIFKQAADPKNIQMAIDLIHQLRTELGPALAKLIDVMRDKKLLEKFVTAITKIVNALTKLIDKTDGLAVFFEIIGKMADIFGWIIDNVPGAGLAIEVFGAALAVLLALKFTGMLKFLRFLSKKGVFDGLKAVGGIATKKGGLKTLAAGLGVGGKTGKFFGSKLVKGGGLAGLVGSVAGGIVGDKVNDHKGGKREVAGRSIKGAATGAGLGASIGAVAGVGVFSWLTAPIGAAIGAILGVIVANWKPIKDWFVNTAFPALTKAFQVSWDFIKGIVTKSFGAVKDVVVAIWGGITSAFSTAFDTLSSIVSAGWDIITKIWNAVWPIISLPMKIFLGIIGLLFLGTFLALKAIVQVGWDAIKLIFTTAFTVIKGIVTAAWTAIKAIFSAIWGAVGPVVKMVWEVIKGYFTTYFNAIKLIVSTAWEVIKTTFSTVFGAIKTAMDVVWTAIKKAWDLAFGVIKKTAETVWGAISGVFSTGIEAVRKILAGASSIFEKAWGGVKKVFSEPIKFVADKIINPFIRGINVGLKVFKIDPIGEIDTKGFATGGRVPGVGSTDTVPAMLTPGEVVIKKRSVEKIGASNLLYANETGRLPGYNKGGKVRPDGRYGFVGGGLIPDPLKDGLKKIGGGALDALGNGVDLIKDVGSKIREIGVSATIGLLVKGLKAIAGPLLGGAAGYPKGASYRMMDKGLDFVKGKDSGGGANNPGLAGALGFARAQAGKPYVFTGVGPNSYDCSGFMGALELFIQGNRNPFQRIISTGSFAGGAPNGWRSGGDGAFSVGVVQGSQMPSGIGHIAGTLNGQNVESRSGDGVLVGPRARGSRDPLFKQHFSLAGYAKGGKVMKYGSAMGWGDRPFDSLDPNGKNFGRAKRSEATAMSGGGLAGLNGGGLIPGRMPLAGYSGGVTSVSNATTNSTQSRSGMTVEQMVINNPVAERASDSIPRSIRKMSYLDSAGTNR